LTISPVPVQGRPGRLITGLVDYDARHRDQTAQIVRRSLVITFARGRAMELAPSGANIVRLNLARGGPVLHPGSPRASRQCATSARRTGDVAR
jgi:hypothetical protein